MFRVTRMSGNYYAMKLADDASAIEDDAENIHQFASEGNPVIIVDELEELEDLGTDPGDVEVVDA